MNETALRATPSINIDEFERRLRATGSLGAADDDPLAELARLLGAEDAPAAQPPAPQAEAEATKPEPQAPPAPALAPPPLRPAPRVENTFGRGVNIDFSGPAVANPPPPLVDEPPPYAEAPAAPPMRRAPARRPAVEDAAPRRKVWPIAALIVIGVAGAASAWAYRGGVRGLVAKAPPLIMAAAGPTRVQPPSQDTVSSPNDIASLINKDQRSRSTAGTVVSNQEQPVDLNERAKDQAAAAAHAEAPPANPPTIAAAPLVVVAAPPPGPAPAVAQTAAPVVAAPSANVAAPSAPPPAPPLTAATAPAAPAPAVAAPPPAVTAPVIAAAAPQPMAFSPPAAPRSIAPIAASPVSPSDSTPTTLGGTVGPIAPPAPPTPFPEPKRVKTVAVRPDGSLIAAAPPDRAEQPLEPPTLPANPPKPVARPVFDTAAAEPATPKLDLPTKLSGKTTTRVPIPKIDTTAAIATGQSPEAPLQIAPPVQQATAPKKHEHEHEHEHEPVRIAPAAPAVPEPAEAAAPSEDKPRTPGLLAALTDSARGTIPSSENSAASPSLRTASTSAAPAEGVGAFAVQLAAPRSEAEAQSVSTRLQAKYASELDGFQPVIRKAELKDKTIYRVRVIGLSHAAAIGLCLKLKAKGGACFLARE